MSTLDLTEMDIEYIREWIAEAVTPLIEQNKQLTDRIEALERDNTAKKSGAAQGALLGQEVGNARYKHPNETHTDFQARMVNTKQCNCKDRPANTQELRDTITQLIERVEKLESEQHQHNAFGGVSQPPVMGL